MNSIIVMILGIILLIGCFVSVIKIDTLIPKKQDDKETNINSITFSKCVLPYK